MAVRVRLFAALREAAGEAETTAAPGPLPRLLDDLRGRYGSRFTERLAVCTVMVDGLRVDPDTTVDVPDGAEVALLPPFSGGAGEDHVPVGGALRARASGEPIPLAAPAAAAVLVGLAAAGPLPFAVGAAVLALAVVVDFAGLLEGAATRPLLVVPLIAVPAAVLLADPATPTPALAPGVLTVAVLVTMTVVLVVRPSGGGIDLVAVTLLTTAVAALGAAGLTVLRAGAPGFGWTAALLILVAAGDLAAGTLGWALRHVPAVVELLVPALAVAAAGVVVDRLVAPGDALVLARVALIAAVATVVGRRMRLALVGPDRDRGPLLTAGLAPLVAAPVTALLVG